MSVKDEGIESFIFLSQPSRRFPPNTVASQSRQAMLAGTNNDSDESFGAADAHQEARHLPEMLGIQPKRVAYDLRRGGAGRHL
jgi:hypothetical protein